MSGQSTWPDMDAVRARAIADAKRAESAAYERGLRRGLVIAREQHDRERAHFGGRYLASMWVDAEAQMEREIEEAKR